MNLEYCPATNTETLVGVAPEVNLELLSGYKYSKYRNVSRGRTRDEPIITVRYKVNIETLTGVAPEVNQKCQSTYKYTRYRNNSRFSTRDDPKISLLLLRHGGMVALAGVAPKGESEIHKTG